jgi:hypothetical protein
VLGGTPQQGKTVSDHHSLSETNKF